MMTISLNKNTVFSALIAFFTLLILVRMIPVSIDENIKLIISKNSTNITSIYQERNIQRTKEVMVDEVNLIVKSRFSHPVLGNIADASDDFFVDIDHTITVKKADDYRFLIGSDDGFSLKIDGKVICDHLSDRPYSVQTCNVNLTTGDHRVQISYFQGYGNSGFTVEYARASGKQHWFGENSSDIYFN